MNDDLHRNAMTLLDEARLQGLHGAAEAARTVLESAAELEHQCADAIDDNEPRSKGIVGVGAVFLWIQAGRLDAAETLAERNLTESILPGYYHEVHHLLQDIQCMREEARLVPPEPEGIRSLHMMGEP